MTYTMKLPVPHPFSFTENLRFLSRSPEECLFHIGHDRISKLIPAGKEHILVEISDGQDGSLLLGFPEPPHGPEPAEAVIRYIKEWFDLDTDLTPFYEMARHDPLLHQVTDRFHGLRNIGIPDLFEALCWGIIGQQINLAFAYTLKKRFVESFGKHRDWNGKRYWIFPTPLEVAALTPSDLTSLQMTAKKSEYLIGVATLMAEEKLSKEQLIQTGDCSAAEKMLVNIRGIGPWTANYVLMRCLRYPDAFPIADVGLHNAIKFLLGSEHKPLIPQIRQLASEWTNWESYATFYLWRSLY
ncbi:DNA-3-methyladenine glycosylase [Paenibacillus tarimensis]